MATGSIAPAIDYAARTFEVLRQRSREVFKLRVGNSRYNALINTDVVPAILDVVAWFHEQNAFYFDRRRLNSLLATADTRESMVRLTQAQGYRMRAATSASVAVQAFPAQVQPAQITLQGGDRIVVGDLTFELANTVVIPAGASVWPDGTTDDIIVFVEGATRTQQFTSDGSEFQCFELSQPNVIEDSVVVTILGEVWDEVESLVFIEGDQRGRDTFVGDGTDSQSVVLTLLGAVVNPEDEDQMLVFVTPVGGTSEDVQVWQQVDSFTGAPQEYTVSQTVDGVTTITFGLAADGSAPAVGDTIDVRYLIVGAQKRYQLTYDQDNRATIRFGNGVFGVIPTAGAQIQVEYRVGGGIAGNVPVEAIDAVIQGVLPSGARTAVTIRNTLEAGSGGEDPETVDHARFFAPRFAKSNERAVTKQDWTTLAETYADPVFGAPAHASAFLKQRNPELNTVRVAVWGRDQNGRLTTAGTPLKLGIKTFLDTKRTITTVVETVDGQVLFFDVEANITLEEGKVRQAVFADVQEAIDRFFLSTFVLPGVDFSISRLYEAIQDVEGVARAEVTKVTGTIRLTITIGTGDAVVNLFTGNFLLEEGTAIVPGSVSITDGTQQVVDDGEGVFTGDVDGAVVPGNPGNVITYDDGEFSISFTSPPAVGAEVVAEAKSEVFFRRVESLESSDGTVVRVDGATDFYPVVRRTPFGFWSGDQKKVIDGFQVGGTAQFRGRLPAGINPTTLVISDSGAQVVTDNGAGTLLQGATPVGTVSYSTGQIDFTFLGAATLIVAAEWTTRRMDVTFDNLASLLPIAAGRIFVWGGFSVDGLQPGGAELLAVDDGEQAIFGNVDVGGLIDYDLGRIDATWDTNPPPGPAGGASFAAVPLVPVPDGVTRQFTFTVPADISRGGAGGEGRTKFQFSDLSSPGVTFEDAYDNHQGRIDGPSLDREGTNTIIYTTGAGTVTFATPPAVASPGTFKVQITNVANGMYAGWVFRVKTPGAPGLDKGLFSDNFGRLWGPPAAGSANPFPTDRLDHLRGRFVADLAGSPIAAGRSLELTYDSLTGVPPALDIPIDGNQVAALGRVLLTEKPPEVNF